MIKVIKVYLFHYKIMQIVYGGLIAYMVLFESNHKYFFWVIGVLSVLGIQSAYYYNKTRKRLKKYNKMVVEDD